VSDNKWLFNQHTTNGLFVIHIADLLNGIIFKGNNIGDGTEDVL
jgi:hypothetical protein